MDQFTSEIAKELRDKFGCHTVVLYGSRARGDWTESSDYDVLGVSDTADRVLRHAYRLNDKYVDGFIYPTTSLIKPDSSHLYMRDGKVIFERDEFGQNLLSALARVFEVGPTHAADELEMKRVWVQKMIERANRGDLEGDYRKHWLIYSLLEDYFAFRELWYEGPKKAFAYLSAKDPGVAKRFEDVFAKPNDISAVEALASVIVR